MHLFYCHYSYLNIEAKVASNKILRNPPDCILVSWVFENFIFFDEAFAKALRILETYVSVNNNLYRKLASSLEFENSNFDEWFKVTSVLFFIPDFNLLSCELNNCTFKVLYFIILYYIKVK